MKTLVLIAHGSRRPQSNDEVRELTELLRTRAGDRFDRVDYAFLELAEPDVPSTLDRAVEAGSDEVYVLPYFLNSGRHVAVDLPEIMTAKRAQHPDVHFAQTRILGAADAIPDILLGLVDEEKEVC